MPPLKGHSAITLRTLLISHTPFTCSLCKSYPPSPVFYICFRLLSVAWVEAVQIHSPDQLQSCSSSSMEGERKQSGSISSDLFGSKSPSNSSKILDSVFPPPSSIRGSGYVRNEAVGTRRKQDSEHHTWSAKNGNQGESSKNSETASNGRMSALFQDEKTEPCYLSSSLYYGGQDLYSNPSNRANTGSSHIFKKDSESEDQNDSASRGNWWQGSLYY